MFYCSCQPRTPESTCRTLSEPVRIQLTDGGEYADMHHIYTRVSLYTPPSCLHLLTGLPTYQSISLHTYISNTYSCVFGDSQVQTATIYEQSYVKGMSWVKDNDFDSNI